MVGLKMIAMSVVLLLAMANPAFAFRCTNMLFKIDAALAEATNLTQAQIDDIKALRDGGAASHDIGNHSLSIAQLIDAQTKLGISDGPSEVRDDY